MKTGTTRCDRKPYVPTVWHVGRRQSGRRKPRLSRDDRLSSCALSDHVFTLVTWWRAIAWMSFRGLRTPVLHRCGDLTLSRSSELPRNGGSHWCGRPVSVAIPKFTFYFFLFKKKKKSIPMAVLHDFYWSIWTWPWKIYWSDPVNHKPTRTNMDKK